MSHEHNFSKTRHSHEFYDLKWLSSCARCKHGCKKDGENNLKIRLMNDDDDETPTRKGQELITAAPRPAALHVHAHKEHNEKHVKINENEKEYSILILLTNAKSFFNRHISLTQKRRQKAASGVIMMAEYRKQRLKFTLNIRSFFPDSHKYTSLANRFYSLENRTLYKYSFRFFSPGYFE